MASVYSTSQNSSKVWTRFKQLAHKASSQDGDAPTDTLVHNALVKFYTKQAQEQSPNTDMVSLPRWLVPTSEQQNPPNQQYQQAHNPYQRQQNNSRLGPPPTVNSNGIKPLERKQSNLSDIYSKAPKSHELKFDGRQNRAGAAGQGGNAGSGVNLRDRLRNNNSGAAGRSSEDRSRATWGRR